MTKKIDTTDEIIDLHYRLLRTQMLLDLIINRNNKTLSLPSKIDIKKTDGKIISILQEKFPNMGIEGVQCQT